ncbi:MAG: hypothetical protein J0I07_07445 [Myxococcales bacterium]|nr:hypothetical protein [Myxococcales bacterium]
MSLRSSLFQPLRRSPLAGLLAGGSVLLVTWAAGCSTYDDRIGYVAAPPVQQPPLSPSTADASVDGSADAVYCATSECPAPYATCGNSQYRCDKNLDSDNYNCGACGVECPGANDTTVEKVLHADWRCSSGACAMSCMQGFSNCNGSPGDGCEVNTQCDPDNCGGCGIKCGDGVECILGTCGCKPGLTQCQPSTCTNYDMRACSALDVDDENCGACGHACPTGDDNPPHTYRGCANSECDHYKCERSWEDCNNDLQKDGCEVDVDNDPNNCGACGFKCAAGQKCSEGQCLCEPGAQLCEFMQGDPPALKSYCFHVDVDPRNCGACGRACPIPPDENATRACRDGRCMVECKPGRADCDADTNNGCETSTDSDPNNCGGCGIKCDIAAGQPCIRGQCALAPCPERPVQ